MVLVYLDLLMENIMKDSILMIKNMVMEYFIGLMVKDMKDGGLKANSTVMVY